MSLLLCYLQKLKTNPKLKSKLKTTPQKSNSNKANNQIKPHSNHHHCPESPHHNQQHFIWKYEAYSEKQIVLWLLSFVLFVFLQEVKSSLNVMSLLLHYYYHHYPEYKVWDISVGLVFLELDIPCLIRERFGNHEDLYTKATCSDSSCGYTHLPVLLLFWFPYSGLHTIKIFTCKD